MLKAIAGVLSCSDGTVRFDGRDLTGRPGHARADSGISYIAQGKCVSDSLSVRDNVLVGAVSRRRRRGASRRPASGSATPASACRQGWRSRPH
jgi:ABC-type branched-subunit amino acid transport system ATPase component